MPAFVQSVPILFPGGLAQVVAAARGLAQGEPRLQVMAQVEVPGLEAPEQAAQVEVQVPAALPH